MTVLPPPCTSSLDNSSVPSHVLVIGFATTGQAVARVLSHRGCEVVAIDDSPGAASRQWSETLGIELVVAPALDELRRLARAAELIVLSPGVPPTHPIFSVASAGALVSELELAARLLSVPIVAVTGTNGKTTVTSLVAEMLNAAGIHARAVGNIGLPLISVVEDDDVDIAVTEVSSFQLANTAEFAPHIGTWLNFSPDHLDWHRDLAEYATAKARIWARQRPSDIAIANLDDPVVMERAASVASHVVTFGAHAGDYRVEGDALVGNDGPLAALSLLPRALPHDLLNALAATATAREAGASELACRDALSRWTIPPHRVELVATINDVSYYDDSKATTPSAVIAALAGFSNVVLIVGGRNKGLDLSAIASFAAARRDLTLRSVVVIGESAEELADAFSPRWPVERAGSMVEAVAVAAGSARPGDAVLLSPGCASFDWYSSYEERGADFVGAVRARRSMGVS